MVCQNIIEAVDLAGLSNYNRDSRSSWSVNIIETVDLAGLS
jgi:hypothetical protein